MSRLRNGTNRAALAGAGLVLLAGGGLLMAAAPGVRRRLPSWWPRPGHGTVLLDRAGAARLRENGWWTPAVIAALAVAALLLLWWVIAQFRSGARGPVPLTRPGVTLRTRALAAAMTGRAAQLPGVHLAHIALHGRPHRLTARATLLLTQDAEPAAVLRRVATDTLAQARTSAAPRPVAADVRLGIPAHRTRRAT
ncbi:hypothetical protein [Streptomyces sp. NBC_01089]|uniref:hypothetical protein n=1 Tax=Streptomyces sp. NBC_01089 TaxID=2903747 RepID=UPI0038689A69|nr:hypothetical protein OG510_19775 [Streptomyces sp. NBC_01089]